MGFSRKLMQQLLWLLTLCPPILAWADASQIARPDGSAIECQLFLPKAAKHPLLVALQGSICGPALAEGIKSIAPLLQSVGFAPLMVEKPGIHDGNADQNCPNEYLQRNTVAQRMADYKT